MKVKKKSLAKNTMYNMVYTLANVIFPLVSSIYVAKILLAEGVGKVAYAQNIASYFVVIGALGLPTYGVREIAKVSKSTERLNQTFTELMIINTISTTIVLGAYGLVVYYFYADTSLHSLFIICGLQIMLNYINVDWFYQGKEEYGYITIRSLIIKVISFGALFLFVRSEDDYLNYALINIITSGGNFLFNIWHLKHFTRLVVKRISYKDLKKHLTPLFILAFSIFLASIYSRVDITMLGVLVSKKEVGLYTYAHRIPEMIIVFCTSITAVFLPRLSLYYKEDRKKFNELVELGVKILCFISVPAAIGFVALAPEIIEMLWGKEFLPAIITARVFSILILVKSFGNLLCYQLIICTGNEKKRLPAYGCAAITNVFLNAVLIPVLGATGAVISSVISELLVNGIQMLSIRKEITLKISSKEVRETCISSSIMLVFVMIVKCTRMTNFLTILVGVISGIFGYTVINILMKNEIMLLVLRYIKQGIKRE